MLCSGPTTQPGAPPAPYQASAEELSTIPITPSLLHFCWSRSAFPSNRRLQESSIWCHQTVDTSSRQAMRPLVNLNRKLELRSAWEVSTAPTSPAMSRQARCPVLTPRVPSSPMVTETSPTHLMKISESERRMFLNLAHPALQLTACRIRVAP